MPLSDVIFENMPETPQETEGSPVMEFGERNTADVRITRKYILSAAATYTPAAIGTADPSFLAARLTKESAVRIGTRWEITRVYETVPITKTEKRVVPFVFPGQSGLVLKTGGGVWSWDRYGRSSPVSKYVLATVTRTYHATSNPATITIDEPTQVTFDGAPVDFTGSVYHAQQNAEGTLTSWTYDGSTTPPSVPSTWVLSCSVSHYSGDIWEKETITLNPYS